MRCRSRGGRGERRRRTTSLTACAAVVQRTRCRERGDGTRENCSGRRRDDFMGARGALVKGLQHPARCPLSAARCPLRFSSPPPQQNNDRTTATLCVDRQRRWAPAATSSTLLCEAYTDTLTQLRMEQRLRVGLSSLNPIRLSPSSPLFLFLHVRS
jgi:hypothetical protein